MINYKYTQTTILFTLLMVLVPTLAFAQTFQAPTADAPESDIIVDCSGFTVTNDQNVEEDTALVKLGETNKIVACKPRVNIRTTNNYLLAPLDLNVATVGKCVDGSFITNITYNTTLIDHDSDPNTASVETGLEFLCTAVGVSNPDSESCIQGEVLTFDTNNRWQCVTAGIAGGLTCTEGQTLQYTDNPDLISCSTCTVNGTAGYNSGCIGFNNSFIGGTNSINSFQCDSGAVYGSSWACADVSAASDTTIADGLTCSVGQLLQYTGVGGDLTACSNCTFDDTANGGQLSQTDNNGDCVSSWNVITNIQTNDQYNNFVCTSGAEYATSDWACADIAGATVAPDTTLADAIAAEGLTCGLDQNLTHTGPVVSCDACSYGGSIPTGFSSAGHSDVSNCQNVYDAYINGTSYTYGSASWTSITTYTCTGNTEYDIEWRCTDKFAAGIASCKRGQTIVNQGNLIACDDCNFTVGGVDTIGTGDGTCVGAWADIESGGTVFSDFVCNSVEEYAQDWDCANADEITETVTTEAETTTVSNPVIPTCTSSQTLSSNNGNYYCSGQLGGGN